MKLGWPDRTSSSCGSLNCGRISAGSSAIRAAQGWRGVAMLTFEDGPRILSPKGSG
jgi:hypothetical protein